MLLGGIGFSQTTNPPTPQTNPGSSAPDQSELNRRRENRRWELRQQQTMRELERSKSLGIRSPNAAREKPLTKEEIKSIDALLAPSVEDSEKYKTFLKGSKTGLFRLFPNIRCETKNLVRVDGACENFVPGGSTFSFRRKTHGAVDFYTETRDLFYFYDLRLDGDDLLTDASLAQGIMVPLGDIPLDAVSLDSNGMRFLNDFKAEVDNEKVRKQFAEIAGVVQADDFYYSKRVRAVENTTYALRVIAYGTQTKIAFRRQRDDSRRGFLKFLKVNTDKRVDVTIAFRVIRKDPNKSVSILWKELKRENAPEIVFRKHDKLVDIRDY